MISNAQMRKVQATLFRTSLESVIFTLFFTLPFICVYWITHSGFPELLSYVETIVFYTFAMRFIEFRPFFTGKWVWKKQWAHLCFLVTLTSAGWHVQNMDGATRKQYELFLQSSKVCYDSYIRRPVEYTIRKPEPVSSRNRE